MYLVIGASGNVGREVTRRLVAGGDSVRVLTRDPGHAVFPTGVEVVQGDLADPGTLASAMKGVTKLYCLMRPGTADNMVGAARDAAVEHIVLLTSMAAESTDDRNPLSQAHRDAEQAVRASGIAWTFLHPTNFASNSLAWAASIRAESTVRAPFGRQRSAVIDPGDIAAVAVIALRSAVHQGRTFPLTGPESLSVSDQVRIIAGTLGRDVAFVEQTPDEARAEMIKRIPPQVTDALLAAQQAAVDVEPRLLDTVEQVTGWSPRRYREWVADHHADFA